MGNQDSLAFGDSSGWGEALVCSDAEHGVLQPEAKLVCRRLDALLTSTLCSRGGCSEAAGGAMEPPRLLLSCAANRSALKLLLVSAGMPLPVGNVPRRNLPAGDPLWSCSSAALCPSWWPFGQGLLPPLPASSPGSSPGAVGPTAQNGRRIYLLIRFSHQLFLPDLFFPERVF